MGKHNRKRHNCEMCTAVFACDQEELSKHHYIVGRVAITVCKPECAIAYEKILKTGRFQLVPASYPGRSMGLPPARIEHAVPLHTIIKKNRD